MIHQNNCSNRGIAEIFLRHLSATTWLVRLNIFVKFTLEREYTFKILGVHFFFTFFQKKRFLYSKYSQAQNFYRTSPRFFFYTRTPFTETKL